MLSWLIDGQLGSILAPVLPSNQLFLAIQHHKQDEVNSLLKAIPTDELRRLSEGGCFTIHVACRFNNDFAVNLLLHKGIPIDFQDTSGNTPLHFAAKYGHCDLCKFLIERGASAGAKNFSQKTPYDLSENAYVRQYLLPLQLAAERAAATDVTGGWSVPGMVNSGILQPHIHSAPSATLPGVVAPNVNVNKTPSQDEIPGAGIYSSVPHPSHIPSATPSAPAVYPTSTPVPMQPQTLTPHLPSQPYSSQIPSTTTTTTTTSSSLPPSSAPVTTSTTPSNPLPQAPVAVSLHEPTAVPIPIYTHTASTSTPAPAPAPAPAPIPTPTAPLAPPFVPVPASNNFPNANQTQPQLQPQPQPQQQPQYTQQVPSSIPLAPTPGVAAAVPTNRVIRPIRPNDGFHSSASDPELQKRYGHIKEQINIAPPPIFSHGAPGMPNGPGAPPVTYSLFGSGASQTVSCGPPVYNRYVVYDAHTNSAVPLPQQQQPHQHQHPLGAPPPPGVMGMHVPPPSVYPSQQQTPFHPAAAVAPPVPYGVGMTPNPTLAGAPPLPPGVTTNVNVFNPATDCDVNIVDASSSSVM